MPKEPFVLLGIDSNDAGSWVLLRCMACGEPSGFHFPNVPLWGRYPLICGCGAESLLELRRPIPGSALVRKLVAAISWAPMIQRRLIPKSN
jgi:hypothetical protein